GRSRRAVCCQASKGFVSLVAAIGCSFESFISYLPRLIPTRLFCRFGTPILGEYHSEDEDDDDHRYGARHLKVCGVCHYSLPTPSLLRALEISLRRQGPTTSDSQTSTLALRKREMRLGSLMESVRR